MKPWLYWISFTCLLPALPVGAQEYDPDAYYTAEETCNQQAGNNPEKDYYEAFQDCMRQHGFGEENDYNNDGYEDNAQQEDETGED